jgi:hypothetical protein
MGHCEARKCNKARKDCHSDSLLQPK